MTGSPEKSFGSEENVNQIEYRPNFGNDERHPYSPSALIAEEIGLRRRTLERISKKGASDH